MLGDSGDDASSDFERTLAALQGAFADSAADTDAMARATIEAAPDASALWRVLMLEEIAWASWTTDCELPPAVAEAVIERALGFSEPERARGLGILSALATLNEAFALVPDPTVWEAKAATLAALCERAETWRDLCGAPTGETRAGAAMLLARLPVAGPADAERLLERSRTETEPAALGGQLIAAAMIVRATADPPMGADVVAAARSCADQEAPVVRLAAAAARALVAGADDAMVDALIESMKAPQPLPVPWGFVDGRLAPTTTHDLAMAALGHAGIVGDRLRDVLPELARSAHPEDALLLLRVAFGQPQVDEAHGRARVRYPRVPPGGLALEALGPFERAALARVAAIGVPWHHRWPLGFHRIDREVPGFLAAEAPRWQPIEVMTAEGERHWHLDLLWRRHVLGTSVARGDAVRAMVEACAPAELLDRVLERMTRIVLRNLAPSGVQKARDRALLSALHDALDVHRLDLGAHLRERLARYEVLGEDDAPALGALLLRHREVHGGTLPDSAARLIESAESFYGG